MSFGTEIRLLTSGWLMTVSHAKPSTGFRSKFGTPNAGDT